MEAVPPATEVRPHPRPGPLAVAAALEAAGAELFVSRTCPRPEFAGCRLELVRPTSWKLIPENERNCR